MERERQLVINTRKNSKESSKKSEEKGAAEGKFKDALIKLNVANLSFEISRALLSYSEKSPTFLSKNM